MMSFKKWLAPGLRCLQLGLLLGVTGSVQAQSVLPAPLLFDFDFDSGTTKGWVGVGTPTRPIPQIQSSITREGKYATRAFLDSSDPNEYRRERVEMKLDRSANATQIGKEYWYGWSVYLASPWPIDPTYADILTQFHKTVDAEENKIAGNPNPNPTLVFTITPEYDGWTILSRSDPRRITTDKEGVRTKSYRVGRYETDKWVDWVVNVKWSYGSDGFLKIWKDGKLVVSDTGPNTYNDVLGPHVKMGIYKPAWRIHAPDPAVKRRLAYHDEFRMADAKGSYDAVAPGKKGRPAPPSLVRAQ